MGLLSFIANAGKKILGIQTHDQPVPQLDNNNLNLVKEHILGTGLNIQGLDVQFAGPGTLTLTGQANSKADAEKAALIAGNILGIVGVNNNISIAAAAPEPDADLYTVDKGDSLWKIAEMYYGSGAKYTDIVAANQPMIKDADEIYPGQVLRIPKQA